MRAILRKRNNYSDDRDMRNIDIRSIMVKTEVTTIEYCFRTAEKEH